MKFEDKPKEQLSKTEHAQILGNTDAENFCKFVAYKGYIKIGFTEEEAKKLIGLKSKKQ